MVVRIGLVIVALALVGLLLLGIGAGAGIITVSSDGIAFAKKDDTSAAGSDTKSNVVSADDLLKQEGVKYVEPTAAPVAVKPAPSPAVVTPEHAVAPQKPVIAMAPVPVATPPAPPAAVAKEKPAVVNPTPTPTPPPQPSVAKRPDPAPVRAEHGEPADRVARGDAANRNDAVRANRSAKRGDDARLVAFHGGEDRNIIRVAAGSNKPLTDPAGHIWEPGAASGFDDGAVADRGDIEIRNTRFPALCRYERWGPTAWRRRLPNGHYTVLLHFCETFDGITGPNQRIFSMDVQGQKLDNLDIFKEAGGLRREIIKNFRVEVKDEKLTIKFIPTDNRVPAINGIEVIPDGPVAELAARRGDNKENPVAIRIAAGSAVPVRDAHGDVWESDNGFDKGTIVDRGPINIDRTDIPDIYRTEHYGMTSWTRKVPNGSYVVNLHFAETSDSVSAAGQRIFHIVVQNQTIKGLDVYHDSGGLRTALIKSTPVKVGNGKLTISFRDTGKNVPEINGIEVIPADDAGKIKSRLASRDDRGGRPAIRVAAGSGAVLADPLGNAWEPDSGFDGGQVVDRGPIIIEHADFPSLYRTEHFGMSAWRKPFPNGKYTVALHFCETWDGVTPASPRVFHVTVQGQPLRDLDVYKETGGARRPLVKTFHVVVATGQLEILFERTNMNVPEINGIEVTPER